MICEICHEGAAIAVRGDCDFCAECVEFLDWYESLTPAERRADDESQARYVAETTGRDW